MKPKIKKFKLLSLIVLVLSLLVTWPLSAEEAVDEYQKILEESKDMTLDELTDAYPVWPVKEFSAYSPESADYFKNINKVYPLNSERKSLFNKNGFVVDSEHNFGSFGLAYMDIFEKDLPVFISADSIMHALHRSYDSILMSLETGYLIPTLTEILNRSHNHLEYLSKIYNGNLPDYFIDADIYYTVSLSLLTGELQESKFKEESQGEVDLLMDLIEKEALSKLKIFGGDRFIDFSQFKPRGHYTQSEHLKKYFKTTYRSLKFKF